MSTKCATMASCIELIWIFLIVISSARAGNGVEQIPSEGTQMVMSWNLKQRVRQILSYMPV